MTDFIETPSEPSYLETLVGEDKKYKTVDDLAKAKVFADEAIARREAENAELRKELESRLNTEELLRRATEQTNARTPVESHKPETATEPAIKMDDLARLVRETISGEKTEETARNNLTSAVNRLVSEFGDTEKANQFVAQKAAELNLTPEFLKDVAAKSPSAFFQTVGIAPQQSTSTPNPSQSDVNASALERSNPGRIQPDTYAYFDSIRKENPSLYHSIAFQNRMHTAAQAKGEAFFKG